MKKYITIKKIITLKKIFQSIFSAKINPNLKI